MARGKSVVARHLEYWPLRFLFWALQHLPLSVGEILCSGLIRFTLLFIPKRRRLLLENVAAAFPGKPADAHIEIISQSIQNLARGIAIMPKIPGYSRDGYGNRVVTEGFEHLDRALARGKGAITFTAHYGCWEMMAVYVTTRYPRIGMLVRPLDNPLLDSMITQVRASGKGSVIPRKKLLREGLTLLRENGILGILVDQNTASGGVFVNFFGRPAASTPIASLLARRTGCAVLPMHNRWEGDHIRIICEPALQLSERPNAAEAMAKDTHQMNQIVERWVREDPGQWFWLHHRWKRRPQAGDALLDDSGQYRPALTPDDLTSLR